MHTYLLSIALDRVRTITPAPRVAAAAAARFRDLDGRDADRVAVGRHDDARRVRHASTDVARRSPLHEARCAEPVAAAQR